MKVLVVSFFPAFTPASSGGELRLGNLYRSLSRSCEITMLTATDFGARFEEVLHTPTFRELRFPKDELWRNAYATLEASGIFGELSGLAFALAVSDPCCALRRAACELARSVDVVIHEFPYSEPIFADGSAACELYNSHNFEAGLLSSIVHGHGFDVALLKLMRLEGNLVARARCTFATSSTDAEKFRLFYGADPARLAICRNGFDDRELAAGRASPSAAANSESQKRSRRTSLFPGTIGVKTHSRSAGTSCVTPRSRGSKRCEKTRMPRSSARASRCKPNLLPRG